MEIALLIAFILSNASWLVFLYLYSKDSKDERRQLLNRIADPEIVIKPDKVLDKELEAFTEATKETPEDVALREKFDNENKELAAVGLVNPEGIKRD